MLSLKYGNNRTTMGKVWPGKYLVNSMQINFESYMHSQPVFIDGITSETMFISLLITYTCSSCFDT